MLLQKKLNFMNEETSLCYQDAKRPLITVEIIKLIKNKILLH